MRISDWISDVCSSDLLLLLAQLAYVYRAQIANNVAALRPVLERACVPLECQIPYARQIDQISIMSSSLRSGTGAAVGSAQADQAAAQGKAAPPMWLQLRPAERRGGEEGVGTGR